MRFLLMTLFALCSASATAQTLKGGRSSLWTVDFAQAGLIAHAAATPDFPKTDASRPDLGSVDAQRYVGALEAAQNAWITQAQSVLGQALKPHFRYTLLGNGMAFELSVAQARKLASQMPGPRIVRDQVIEGADAGLSQFLGLPPIWTGGGVPPLLANTGDGVVVGVVDSGIHFQHPAFSATAEDGYTHVNPLGNAVYRGWCNPTHPQYSPIYACNSKVIGAWDFLDGIRLEFPINSSANGVALENDGPRDNEGHGSAAASIAAGNRVAALGIAGAAPRASIISYDACGGRFFLEEDGSIGSFIGGTVCSVAAIRAALEQALLDGVDVINFSNSGGVSPWTIGDIDRLFLDLLNAGTMVAASAGNDALKGTVQHLGPWTATVGATQRIERQLQISATGNASGGLVPSPPNARGPGADPNGLTPAGVPPSDLVYAGDLSCIYSGFGPVCAGAKQFCEQRFVASEVRGKILVCDARPSAGGSSAQTVASIDRAFSTGPAADWPRAIIVLIGLEDIGLDSPSLVDQTSFSPNLPLAIALAKTDGDRLRTWVRAGGAPRLGISAPLFPAAPIETLATFSSRGPVALGVAKPTLVATGDEVEMANRAQQAFDSSPPPLTNARNGTSFSTPFVAGALALLRKQYPALSPAETISLLAASGKTAIEQAGTGRTGTIFDVGGGRLQAASALRVPLSFPETYARFLAADPARGGDPSALNLPSFLAQNCAQRCEWQRTVKNIQSTALTFSSQVSTPASVTASVTPSQFTLAPGASQTLTIRADAVAGIAPESVETVRVALRSNGLPDTVLSGALSGVNGRIPNELRIDGVGLSGAQTLRGFSLGLLSAANVGVRVGGAVDGTLRAQSLIQDSDTDPFNNQTGVLTATVPVAANAPALIAEVLSTTSADLDLYVGRDLNADGALQGAEVICTSATEAAIERCKVDNPAAGTWIVLLQNYASSAPGASDPIRLSYAALTRNPAGNLSATAPASIQAWTPFELQITWNFTALAERPPRYGFIEITDSDQVRAGFALTIMPIESAGLIFANGFE